MRNDFVFLWRVAIYVSIVLSGQTLTLFYQPPCGWLISVVAPRQPVADA